MPQAVDSNSINMPEIHPLYLIDALADISNALQAYRVMLASLLDSGDGLADNISHGVGLMLDCVINRFDEQREHVRIFVRQFDTLTAGQAEKRVIRPLRDKFIIEQLEQGFTAEQISQALNLRIQAIRRVIKSCHAGQEAQYRHAAV